MIEFDFSQWHGELHFTADIPKDLYDLIMGYDHPERLFEPGNSFTVGTADGKREARYVCISEEQQKQIEELAGIVSIIEEAREKQKELYESESAKRKYSKAFIHGTHVEFCDQLLRRIDEIRKTGGSK